jgi:hypothetical protein
MLVYALSGALSVRTESRVFVQRAGEQGGWNEVATGTTVALRPGDALLLLAVDTAEFTNPGSEPAEILDWSVSSGTSSDPPMPAEWIPNEYDLSGSGGVSLAGTSARLRLRRVRLGPNVTLEPSAQTVVQLVLGLQRDDAGTPQMPFLFQSPDGTVQNIGGQITVYLVTLELAAAPSAPRGVGAPGASPTPIAARAVGAALAMDRLRRAQRHGGRPFAT